MDDQSQRHGKVYYSRPHTQFLGSNDKYNGSHDSCAPTAAMGNVQQSLETSGHCA